MRGGARGIRGEGAGMASGEKEQGLRRSIFAALRARFGAGAADPDASAFGAPPDPAKLLFPRVEGAMREAEEEATLAVRLEKSARAIIERRAGLREGARAVSTAVADRRAGEISLAAQSLRLVIGFAWMGVAVWLYLTVANNAPVTPYLPQVSAADAIVLMQTFFVVGAVGLGAAILAMSLTAFVGGADNASLRGRGEALGEAIAIASKEFDEALDAYRRGMDERVDPADAVIDLSRAHLTALEAQAFFRELAFLFDADSENAGLKFRGFLRSYSSVQARRPVGPIFVIGAAIGAALTYAAMSTFAPGGTESAAPAAENTVSASLAIARYPWAMAALLGGGAVYAAAGLLMEVMLGAFASPATGRGVDEALDALRSAFTAREAPRPVDVIRRIEDALAVFRARVGRLAKRDRAANQSAGETAAHLAEEPAWRRRDASVRFVDTGFQAAPKSWRADPHIKIDPGETAPKRGSRKLDKGDGN